jgi:(E)-4-hydroxy-3-methylbut-2-enyl-diphosphate synthase
MKASNPRVMIAAYRLLVKRMADENMNYPLHLGVTEAGDGPDGRIKSAAGIGSLLDDGIGDTIRVSLTEDPEFEIPVAKEIAARYDRGLNTSIRDESNAWPGFTSTRRETEPFMAGPISIGGASPIRVVSNMKLEADSKQKVMGLMEDFLKQDTPPEVLLIPYEGASFEEPFEEFRYALSQETKRLGLWVAFEAGKLPSQIGFSADGYVYRFEKFADENELVLLNEACRRNSAYW